MFGETNNNSNNWILIVGICVAILLLLCAAYWILRFYHKRKIMRSFAPTRKDVFYVLNLTFGKKNVLKNVYLPIFNDKNVITSYVFADTVILMKTGIAVCRFRTESGMIFCGYGPTWHQTARLRSGGTRELDFVNPTLANQKAVEAIRRLFAYNDLEEPPVYGFVIFTAQSVSFQQPIENVYRLDRGLRNVRALRHASRLQGTPQKDFREIISHYSVRKSAAEKYNIEGKE